MANAELVATSHSVPPDGVRRAGSQPATMQNGSQVMVEFRALGPIEAMVGDRQVDLGAPKQRALLALLVSRVGQPVTADVMLEELWAGRPPRSAMTSLQAYVANLRRALEPDRAPRAPATVLRTCGQGYLLDSSVVDVDVDWFGDRATSGRQAWDRGDAQRALGEFEAALALWRGPAYAEVADTAYVEPEVARLEELRLSVAETRCAALLAVGAHEVAVAELDAFMQTHPLREYGCELLGLALYRSGRQADALSVLRTNRKRLAEELGIDPRPALQHLEQEILNQSPALDWRPAPAAAAVAAPVVAPAAQATTVAGPAADDKVFVGRQAALRQLAAGVGKGQMMTVSGEPGIGKTSLLRRFARQAGVPVLWGACPEHAATPPLWPWEQVLRAASTRCPQRSVPGPVAELLDGGGGQPTDTADAAATELRLFEAIVDYLTGASDAAPLVVVLDDLHQADQNSLRLLAHLAESVAASRLLVAVSYRPGETAILGETTAALARAGVSRIELTGLDIQDTQTLASAMLHREVSKPTAEEVWARTEGNPFFLRELVQLLGSEQRLEQPHTVPVPAPVRDVELRRVARLPQTAAEVLSVAAIVGRHFDIAVVAEAASIEIETAVEVIDAAVEAGLIVEDQQRLGWYRFTHALTAQALSGTTTRLRRARLHRRIGAAMVRSRKGGAGRAAEIARYLRLLSYA